MAKKTLLDHLTDEERVELEDHLAAIETLMRDDTICIFTLLDEDGHVAVLAPEELSSRDKADILTYIGPRIARIGHAFEFEATGALNDVPVCSDEQYENGTAETEDEEIA